MARKLTGLNGRQIGATDIPPGTVRSIIKQAGLTVEEFIASL